MQFSVALLAGLASTALAAPSLVSRQYGAWAIRGFTSDCTNPNICTYNFNIDQGNGVVTPCTVVDKATPATTHSWYGLGCQQSPDWQASWGWDASNSFTVLTVKNLPNQLQAYYGYNNPNSAAVNTYADVGPNPVSRS